MATKFTEDINTTITAKQRQDFLTELAAAHKASEAGSNDIEIDKLWDLVATACNIFEVYSEDMEIED